MGTRRPFTRREFLKKSAITGGGLAMVSGLPAARGLAETKNVSPPQEGFKLRCEYALNPLGIDVLHPRFSWKIDSRRRGRMQSAYQVLVATVDEKLSANAGDLWDSGKVISDRSVNIPYAGHALKSGQKGYWKVRVWDEKGRVSDSLVATFEMGLLARSDWEGKWIGAKEGISAPLLRKEFTVDKQIARARVYVSGLGYYELYINGNKVGDNVHDPGVTYYDNAGDPELRSRILYVTYDVTDYLKAGRNAVGVILGNGWYSPAPGSNSSWVPGGPDAPFGSTPCLMMQMNVEYANSGSLHVVTDDSWKATSSPITYNSFIHGETYDARLEKPGWDSAAYDDSGWEQATLLTKPPNGVLTAQMLPPIRVMETIKPVRILKPKDAYHADVDVYDLGQNITGWVKLRVSGPKGTVLTLEHGTNIYDDNILDARSSNSATNSMAKQTDTYILKGEGIEEWEPKFTLHGFRYVQVRGLHGWYGTGGVTSLELEGRFARSAVETSGYFSCSNQLINQIHHNNLWTFMSSCQSIFQDAADRAERVGWNGDPSWVAEDYIYNLDMASFWTKWLNDFQDGQRPNGDVPVIAPIPCGKNFQWLYGNIPDYTSSYLILAWFIYQYYGDEQILEQHYESLRKYVDRLATYSHEYIISEGIGDQMEPTDEGTSTFSSRRTPIALTVTAEYYWQVTVISQIADILGKSEDAKRFSELAEKIKNAFNLKFLNQTTNQYGSGSQTSNALPLYVKLVPEANVKGVLENLIYDIVRTHRGHLWTGTQGTNALQQVLPEHGAADVMFQIATQTTFPGWGYQVVSKGATTTCESWECAPWISQNMKLLAMIEKFFYKDLAGIGLASPGFRRIAIKPRVVGDLGFVSASLDTVRGVVSVDWRKSDRSFEIKVTIPVNSQAEVSIPTLELQNVRITESGNTVWKDGTYLPGVNGISGGRETEGSVTVEVGSGTYTFELTGA